MTETLILEIPRRRSDTARRVLQRITWRGYLPPESGDAPDVVWHLPTDQIDLLRSVLRRNRRLAGDSQTNWGSIDRVCETIAEESKRHGLRPNYGYDDTNPDKKG